MLSNAGNILYSSLLITGGTTFYTSFREDTLTAYVIVRKAVRVTSQRIIRREYLSYGEGKNEK